MFKFSPAASIFAYRQSLWTLYCQRVLFYIIFKGLLATHDVANFFVILLQNILRTVHQNSPIQVLRYVSALRKYFTFLEFH